MSCEEELRCVISDLCEQVRERDAEIARLRSQGEPVACWISVKERLPDSASTVLVCAGGFVGIGGYEPNFGWWFMGADFGDDDSATHWMPLPDAPEPRK